MNRPKQFIILSLIFITALLLGACAPAQTAAPAALVPAVAVMEKSAPAMEPAAQAAPESAPRAALTADYENAVPIEQQLIFGTLKLTGLVAVTKEQAAILLPLWTNLKTLSESMAPQQGEANTQTQSDVQSQIESLVKEIEAAMTDDQVKAIADMKITMKTAQTIMQEQNISMEEPNGGGNGGQPPQGNPPEGASNGTPPAMPGGNGGQPPSGGRGQPGDEQRSPVMMLPPGLIDALIQILEQISAG